MALDLNTARERVMALAMQIYGDQEAEWLWSQLAPRLTAFSEQHPQWQSIEPGLTLDERDVLLITYGDQLRSDRQSPLETLRRFIGTKLTGLISGLHLLPHYPYSSDDGFSVIDYRQVDPELGDWGDVEALAADHRLMLDAVINHVSAKSEWFSDFLAGVEPFDRFFIALDPDTDVSSVYRPREHPLLTPFESSSGTRHLWTTFSTDQIDLDYRNPQVLLEVVDILLDYVGHGAELLRLDAVGLLYKELGTSCLHLPQTHGIVKLLRVVFDAVAPQVLLVPEINGPFEENEPYFGDGSDEAQLVYNFTLPPLVLHAFHAGRAEHLTSWLATVPPPRPGCTYFNFLASHDGIGVRPAEPLLPTEGLQLLIERTEAHGGRVNYRSGGHGERCPYELTTTLYDGLTAPGDSIERGVARFRAAHAIMVCLQGMPGLYFHSLFGTPNWHEGLAATGENRTLNRRKLTISELEQLLADEAGRGSRVFAAVSELLRVRRAEPAFHPAARQHILALHPKVLAVRRQALAGYQVLCLTNVSEAALSLPINDVADGDHVDLLTGTHWSPRGSTLEIELGPYGVCWLRH
ncbi:MAG: sugar phosphorylase [Deltaproteobacteria bacterium]|nr:MAG: sugar phosphorylase [Deltaproteobacteria bacterium]